MDLQTGGGDAGPRDRWVTGDANDCWVTFELDGHTGVRLNLRPGGDRRWLIVSLLVSRAGAESGLDTEIVRSLPLGVLMAEARRLATREFGRTPIGRGLLEDMVRRQGTRLGRTDIVLAAVAEEYAYLVARGDRAPAKTLSTRHGGTAGTWTNRIALARQRGLLQETVRGEAGGAVTAKAIELIRGASS